MYKRKRNWEIHTLVNREIEIQQYPMAQQLTNAILAQQAATAGLCDNPVSASSVDDPSQLQKSKPTLVIQLA